MENVVDVDRYCSSEVMSLLLLMKFFDSKLMTPKIFIRSSFGTVA